MSVLTIRKSKKLRVVQIAHDLKIESTITKAIKPSESAAATTGRRMIVRKRPFSRPHVSTNSAAANQSNSVMNMTASAPRCSAAMSAPPIRRETREASHGLKRRMPRMASVSVMGQSRLISPASISSRLKRRASAPLPQR